MTRLFALVEQSILLVIGSAMFGIWILMLLRWCSGIFPLLELAAHPSLHIYLFSLAMTLIASIGFAIQSRDASNRLRWRRRLIALVIPTLFYTWVIFPWRLLPWIESSSTAENSIKILSWNVQTAYDDLDVLKSLVEEEKPDVIVLIEVTPRLEQELSALQNEYPLSKIIAMSNSSGIAVLSKIRGSSFEHYKLADVKMPSIQATIPSGSGEPFSLLAVHTLSPYLDDSHRIVARDKQLKSASDWSLSHQDRPAIVIGDFNITPWSPAYWSMLSDGKLTDSTWYRGYFPTWPAGFGAVAIPIDHALINAHVKVLDRRTLPDNFHSDHRPIVITVESNALTD